MTPQENFIERKHLLKILRKSDKNVEFFCFYIYSNICYVTGEFLIKIPPHSQRELHWQ